MKIRAFITDGDQLQLQNAVDKFDCRLELGGPPECDGTLPGFERQQKHGPSKWVVTYLHVDNAGQAMGIRLHFLHSLQSA